MIYCYLYVKNTSFKKQILSEGESSAHQGLLLKPLLGTNHTQTPIFTETLLGRKVKVAAFWLWQKQQQ